jgi:saccharopine dehydrogenase-like NADP-dependent oxidoreductase
MTAPLQTTGAALAYQPQPRKYDVILLGATGYTGTLAARYIYSNYPSDVKWAIAGRNATKISQLAASLEELSSGKQASHPATETVNFNLASLTELAKNTRLLISTIGPYQQHGSLPFQACAENGTHYIDWYNCLKNLLTIILVMTDETKHRPNTMAHRNDRKVPSCGEIYWCYGKP